MLARWERLGKVAGGAVWVSSTVSCEYSARYSAFGILSPSPSPHLARHPRLSLTLRGALPSSRMAGLQRDKNGVPTLKVRVVPCQRSAASSPAVRSQASSARYSAFSAHLGGLPLPFPVDRLQFL